jgi:2Fe-2S ferredoxin
MPQITFIHFDGTRQEVQASIGNSVMQEAMSAGVHGIVGECGGAIMCATCHVIVDEAWVDKVPAPRANELEMLDCTASERQASSRLSCQIKMTADLEGLTVLLPERQY